MSAKRLSVLVALLSLAACVSHPPAGTREFPLLAGGGTKTALVRVDIDNRKPAPPPLKFEVDCTSLPYAKGEERDFCYTQGAWGVLRHERGIIVACSCGEFGGFVLWYGKDGSLLQKLIAGDVPQTLIADEHALLCVTGISHLSLSRGAIQAFRLVEDRWQAVATTPLAKETDSIETEPDGSLTFKLKWDGGVFRYRAGVLQPVHPTPRRARGGN